MLILTRRVGETVMIGNDITVTVLGVKGNKSESASTRRRKLPCTAKRSTNVSSAKSRLPVAQSSVR
jgi:hypothetical protein